MASTLRGCVIQAFDLPDRDRFQTITGITERAPHRMIFQDLGLSNNHSDKVVVVQTASRQR